MQQTNTNKNIAITVGALFIIATAVSVAGFAVLPPILNAPDFLSDIAANQSKVIIGVLLGLVNCAAVVVIPIMLFPIFKKQNETLAIGYVSSRIMESLILIIGSISLLTLLTLSQEYTQASMPDRNTIFQ